MSIRIRITMGLLEVEYEGPEAFLNEELPKLLAHVSQSYRESGLSTGTEEAETTPSTAAQKEAPEMPKTNGTPRPH